MPYEALHLPAAWEGAVWPFVMARQGSPLQMHTHRELEVNIVTRGKGTYIIHGGRYSIGPESLLWLFPDQPHVLTETTPDFSMWVAVFRRSLVNRLTKRPALQVLRRKDPGTVLVGNLEAFAYSHLVDLCRRLHGISEADPAYLNAGLGFLLRQAWESGQQAAPLPAAGHIHPAVEKAIHLLRTSSLDGSLIDLARTAGLSYSRLCHLFREQVGLTLGDFRNRLRVERLRSLAERFPQRTLLDLALQAGFGSYAQCHRTVRRLRRESPSAWRRPGSAAEEINPRGSG